MPLRALETEHLRLQPVRADDVDALHALWTDAGVRRYLWDDIVIERERAAAAVERALANEAERGFGLWTLQLHAAETVVGFCGFNSMEDPAEIELLYGLLPDLWGRGLAVEASRAALDELFATVAPARVWALADPPNHQSFRVMEKLGMRFSHAGEANGLPARFYLLEGSAPV